MPCHSLAQDSIADQKPTQLLSLSVSEWYRWFAERGIKAIHADAVLKSICHLGIADFHAMPGLSQGLRQRLSATARLCMPSFEEGPTAPDGTRKWLLPLAAGGKVETVYIPTARRGTLCISTQAGCSLNCAFCATGQQGFQRNLDTAEIIAQVWRAHQSLADFRRGSGHAISNIVMMGMGEPLLNFDNVAAAVSLLLDHRGFGIASRRLTVSTAGIAPAIVQIPKHLGPVSLAVSLHAADDQLRDQLVPLNRKYPLADLLEACREYLGQLAESRRSITFQYTLLRGINDASTQARDLARLLADIPCKINLIPFNPVPGLDFARPNRQAVDSFASILRRYGYRVLLRTERGSSIDAACGQLTGELLVRHRRGRHSSTAAVASC